MDFVDDQLALGKKFRILIIVDTHSRLRPAADPRFSYRGEDVAQTLEPVCGSVGYLRTNISEKRAGDQFAEDCEHSQPFRQ